MLGVLAEPRIHPSHQQVVLRAFHHFQRNYLRSLEQLTRKEGPVTFLLRPLFLAITRSCAIRDSNCDSCVLNLDEKAVAPSDCRRDNLKRNSSMASCNLQKGIGKGDPDIRQP